MVIIISSLFSNKIQPDYTTVHNYHIKEQCYNKNLLMGVDILELTDFKILENKNIALLANQTSINSNGKHIHDMLIQASQKKQSINFKTIFAPEHGYFGDYADGQHINNSNINSM